MLRNWLSAHRSLVATATSGALIAAVVATIAIVSTGYTAQKMELDDASVWVANGSQQVIGRANTEVLELNSVVRAGANQLETVQSGDTVLLVDHANATVDTIDPATSAVVDTIALPPDQAEVYLAGDRVVIFEAGTGELWIMPLIELSGFDATAPASLSLGRDAVVTVTPSGMLFAYSPEVNEVRRVDATRSDEVDATWGLSIEGGSRTYEITAAGDRWAVLDVGTRILHLDGRTVDLTDEITATDGPKLQLPGPASDRLLVGTNSALISVPFSGANPVPLAADRSGTSAAPLVLDGCEYGAWTDGTSWRRCPGDGGAGTELDLDEMPGRSEPDLLGERRACGAQRHAQRRDLGDPAERRADRQLGRPHRRGRGRAAGGERRRRPARHRRGAEAPGRGRRRLRRPARPRHPAAGAAQRLRPERRRARHHPDQRGLRGHRPPRPRHAQPAAAADAQRGREGPDLVHLHDQRRSRGHRDGDREGDRARARRELAAAAGAHDQDHRRAGRPDLDPGGRGLGRSRRRRHLSHERDDRGSRPRQLQAQRSRGVRRLRRGRRAEDGHAHDVRRRGGGQRQPGHHGQGARRRPDRHRAVDRPHGGGPGDHDPADVARARRARHRCG